MPSIRASGTVNLRGWQAAPTAPAATVQTKAVPSDSQTPVRSSIMHASMPLMASTADAFTRQFYSQDNLPQQRILPAKKGAGT